MNAEPIKIRLDRVKEMLGHLPVPEDLDSIAKALDMFGVILKELRVIYCCMALQKASKDRERDPD
jgi:hypothetical protein